MLKLVDACNTNELVSISNAGIQEKEEKDNMSAEKIHNTFTTVTDEIFSMMQQQLELSQMDSNLFNDANPRKDSPGFTFDFWKKNSFFYFKYILKLKFFFVLKYPHRHLQI